MMKAGKTRIRILLTILMAAAGILLFGLIYREIQSRMISRYMKSELKESSTAIQEDYAAYKLSGESIGLWLDRNHQAMFSLLKLMTEEDPGLTDSREFLKDMNTAIQAKDLILTDRDGDILASASDTFADLKDARLEPLFETFQTQEMTNLSEYSLNPANTRQPSDGVEKTDNARIFYAMAIDDQRAYVIYENDVARLLYTTMTNAWDYTLRNKVIGSDGFAFAWSEEADQILYYPNRNSLEQDLASLGLKRDQLRDGELTAGQIEGKEMYLYSSYMEEEGTWVVCAVPAQELSQERDPMSFVLWVIFGVLAADIAYYVFLLLRKKKNTDGKSSRRKVITFTLFCSVILFLCSVYLQTLFLISRWAGSSTAQVLAIEKELEINQKTYMAEGFRSFFVNEEEKLLKMSAWYLEQDPENETADRLDVLEKTVLMQNMHITDEFDSVTAASSSYMPEDTIQSVESQNRISLKVPLREAEGRVTGSLHADCLIGLSAVVDTFRQLRSLSGILETVRPGEGGFVFAVDQSSQKFLFHPAKPLVGKNALDYGLKKSDLQDNLCKFLRMNNENFFVVTGQSGENLIFMAIQRDKLLRECLPLSLMSTLAAFVILLLIGLPIYTLSEEVKDVNIVKPGKVGHSREQSEERKVFRNLFFGALVIAAWFLLRRLIPDGDEGIFDYILNGNWEPGIHVFALTASLIFVFEAGLVLFVIRRIVDILSQMLSVRVMTILSMLTSLVNYAGVFLIVYRCLVYFGMDPAVLMTSAGIVSVVIGIGANSLVGDIIAGILLLMEGDVQIGDIVRIGDFRGRVTELGIRKSKLQDLTGSQVKIIPNKEIREVVHLTMHMVSFPVLFLVPYEEDLERVEALIKEALETMPQRIPKLSKKPVYMGVEELGDNGVILRILATCHEENRFAVTRSINRDIYMMYNRNGIEVPYQQFTIHNASEEG